MDKELAQLMGQDPASPWPSLVFDESGNFVLFPSLLGIKVGLHSHAAPMSNLSHPHTAAVQPGVCLSSISAPAVGSRMPAT